LNPTRVSTYMLAALFWTAVASFAGSAPRIAQTVPTPITGSPSGDLSFEEAWTRLSLENAGLESSRQLVEKAKNDRNSARILYLPKVDIDASYTRIDEPLIMDLEPIREVIATLHQIPESMIPPFVDEIEKPEFGRVTVSGTWVLFSGGKRPAANKAASARLKDAEAQHATSLAETRSLLVERYFGLRLAREVLSVRRELQAAMERHAEEARKIEKAGLIAKAERLHAEVALADARMEAQSSENDVASAQAGLESVLPQSSDVLPSTALFMVKLTKDQADYQDAFLEHQPILKRLDANVNLAKAGVQAQTGRFMPDIYAFGKDELYRDDLTILDPKWAVGVGVKLPLFEGGQRVFDSAAARHQLKSVEALQEQSKRDLSALVDVRFQEMKKAQDRFTALESTVDLARENERVRTKAFEAGMSTSLEVTDAQLMLAKARLERLAAAYEYDLALARLLEATGQSEKFEELRKAGTEVRP
jgi:outer membrane protein TolC